MLGFETSTSPLAQPPRTCWWKRGPVPMTYGLLMLAVVVCAGCYNDTNSAGTAIPAEDLLSDAARIEHHLPDRSALTLGTPADIVNAKSLDTNVTTTVALFLKPTGRAFQICAARPIGKYLLLWISFPQIADGGIDLIYSVQQRKIVGEFCGGYRG